MTRRQPNQTWNVILVPDGTPEEAEAAARRVRRMVADWILRNARTEAEDTAQELQR